MKYRVINMTTKEDITDKEFWVVRPNGELGYMEYGDFIGDDNATYISEYGMDMLKENLVASHKMKD